MKVFVLENGCYSDTHIVGVYSTEANAELASRIFKDDPTITEYDVDEIVDEMRLGRLPYFVRLQRDTGHILECDRHESSYGVHSSMMGEDIHKNLFTYVWADSREHAIKIASERRREFLAELKG